MGVTTSYFQAFVCSVATQTLVQITTALWLVFLLGRLHLQAKHLMAMLSVVMLRRKTRNITAGEAPADSDRRLRSSLALHSGGYACIAGNVVVNLNGRTDGSI